MESYEKLVRDKIPEILDEKSIPYEKRIASPEEYRDELIKKLGEEIGEFSEAGDVEELADIIEVVEALKELPQYKDVLLVKEKKKIDRGGFEGRIILKGQK